MKSCGVRRDPLKALILERQKTLSISGDSMAAIIGVSRYTWSRLINHRHTNEWPLGWLIAICLRLNITRNEFVDCIVYRKEIK